MIDNSIIIIAVKPSAPGRLNDKQYGDAAALQHAGEEVVAKVILDRLVGEERILRRVVRAPGERAREGRVERRIAPRLGGDQQRWSARLWAIISRWSISQNEKAREAPMNKTSNQEA